MNTVVTLNAANKFKSTEDCANVQDNHEEICTLRLLIVPINADSVFDRRDFSNSVLP